MNHLFKAQLPRASKFETMESESSWGTWEFYVEQVLQVVVVLPNRLYMKVIWDFQSLSATGRILKGLMTLVNLKMESFC